MLSLLSGTALTCVHDYWKTIALTIQTFVGKVMSLLFNMLSKFVIAFHRYVIGASRIFLLDSIYYTLELQIYFCSLSCFCMESSM